MARPTEKGGLGLTNIQDLNSAYVMKHIWNIAADKEQLWVKWIHDHYLKEYSIWTVPLPRNCSWCMHSIFIN